jgi:ABC-type hemin transport system ATPase subunit
MSTWGSGSQVVCQVFNAAAAGRSRVLLIEGPVGSGKTAIIEALTGSLRTRRDCKMTEILEGAIIELAGLPGVVERETRLGLQAQQILHEQCCSSAVPHAALHVAKAEECPAGTPGEQQLIAAAVLFQSYALAKSAGEARAAVDQLLTCGFRPCDANAP